MTFTDFAPATAELGDDLTRCYSEPTVRIHVSVHRLGVAHGVERFTDYETRQFAQMLIRKLKTLNESQ